MLALSQKTNPILSFGYYSNMIDTVNNAVRRNLATIHCAYSGKPFGKTDEFLATAEHIKPHSVGKKEKDKNINKDSNLFPVLKGPNLEREYEPLDSFIRNSDYPVIQNVCRTIKEVARLKSEKFNGLKWAKEVVETFYRESGIKLKINFDNIGSIIEVPTKKLARKKNKPPQQTVNTIIEPKRKQNQSMKEQLEKLFGNK